MDLNEVSVESEESIEGTILIYKSEIEIEESLQLKKNALFSKLSDEMSRKIKQQQQYLPNYLLNAEDLVGKTFLTNVLKIKLFSGLFESQYII